MSEAITITREDGGGHTVRQGDKYADKLTRDEALYVVASWIVNGSVIVPYLKTQEDHDAFDQQLVAMRKRREAEEQGVKSYGGITQ